jgi:hypothetical protein
MDFEDFNALEAERRENIVWEWAFLVAVKKSGRSGVKLYSYSDFFIEVSSDLVDNNTEEIKAFSKEEFLARHNDVVRICGQSPFLKRLFPVANESKIMLQ